VLGVFVVGVGAGVALGAGLGAGVGAVDVDGVDSALALVFDGDFSEGRLSFL